MNRLKWRIKCKIEKETQEQQEKSVELKNKTTQHILELNGMEKRN